MLTDDDLAYMRATQDDARPTQATLTATQEAPDGMGGTQVTNGAPRAVTVRVANTEKVPEALADRYQAPILTVTLDLLTVSAGDRITVGPDEAYEVVSDGALNTWQTAQQVLAVRIAYPPEGA